jgi:hypothetical protein
VHQSSMELVELRANMWGPPHKAKYSSTTDSEQVRRLNDEKHRDKRSEKYLKPCAYKRWELKSASADQVTVCLLHNDLAS